LPGCDKKFSNVAFVRKLLQVCVSLVLSFLFFTPLCVHAEQERVATRPGHIKNEPFQMNRP
jgi:hypothetical protein